MDTPFENIFTSNELSVLSSIVQVGDATYRELIDSQHTMFTHPYFSDLRGRMRTKLVQMQCEIESHSLKFPFKFTQRQFQYKQVIPELTNENVILHIARSPSPDVLSYKSKYKTMLSNNNHSLQRQLIIDTDRLPPYNYEPYYGILTFGGNKQLFSVIQFPEPGYNGIAKCISLPNAILNIEPDNKTTFERKKAVLKKEFLSSVEEVIS